MPLFFPKGYLFFQQPHKLRLHTREWKPDDMYVPRWFSGKDSAYDVTVVNPLQIKYIDKAGTHAGLAAAGASARKVNALRSTSEFSVIDFVPLAVECFERWDQLALQHFSALARRLSL